MTAPGAPRRTRVLILTTYYHPVIGGVETHARQLAAHLHRAGYPVQVVTKRVDPSQPRTAMVDEVAVHRVGPAGERSAAGKWIALPAFLGALVARSAEFDVIVCVDYRGTGVAAIAAGRLLGRPVIAQGETAGVLAGGGGESASGLASESSIARLLKAPLRAVYRHADRIVCIGRGLEREALGAGVPRDRVEYLPHGVDVEKFRPAEPGERDRIRQRLGWPLDRRIVLFVGRLSLEKGVMDLMEAWRSVDRSDAMLVLVGPDMPGHPWDAGGPAREHAARHGLGGRVRFEGATADPSPFYRAADIFVQPSHFEALGNTAIEAMASGLPVVSSGVGGLSDFCVDGTNAVLHDPRSPASLARALERAIGIVDDSPARDRMAQAARQTAVERFEVGALLDRYARLIDDVAGGSRRAPRE